MSEGSFLQEKGSWTFSSFGYRQMTNFSKIGSLLIERPENLYLIIALIYGVLFLTTTPPFQVPDEVGHFYRSYQLSDGQLVATVKNRWIGANVPKSLILLVNATKDNPGRPLSPLFDLPLNDNDRTFAINIGQSFYSPVPYLPQVTGITLGKMIDLSPLKLMYIGRLLNLLTSIIIVYIAIRITPVQKWLFLLLTLTPTFLFLSASLSADTFTNAISILWLAIVLRYSLAQRVLGRWEIALLILIATLLVLSKQAYIPLVLLFFLIRMENFGSTKNYLFTLSLLLFSVLLASFSWSYTIADIVKAHFINWKYPLTPDEKLIFITHEPLKYLGIIINSFKSEGLIFADQFIGRMGLLDVYLPRWIVISCAGTILVAILCSPEKKEIPLRLKDNIIILFSVLASILMIYTSLYIMYSSMKDNLIGIHGRYFIPVATPFLILLQLPKHRFTIKWLNLIVVPLIIVWLTCSILILFQRYY